MNKPPDCFRVIVGILVCFLGGGVVGCATIDDLSTQTYRKIGLPSKVSEGEGFGFLPLFGRISVRNYLPEANEIFLESIQQQRTGLTWIDPQESLRRIRAAGLEATYQDLTTGSSAETPPRQEPLQRIGKAVGVRYLLLTEVQRVETTEGATQVRLKGRLWDTEKGETLWEGVGESRGYVFLIFPRVPSSFEKTMAVASRGLIERLPF